jgi:hypothetical protein
MSAGKVKTLSIVSILLGTMGVFSALAGTLSLLAGPENTMGVSPAQTPELAAIQLEMAKALAAVTSGVWKTYNGLMISLSLLVSVGLLVGGIMGFKLRDKGRSVLVTTFIGAIPLKIVQAVGSVYIGMTTIRILQEFMPKMMKASVPGGGSLPPGAEGVTSSLALGGAVIGIVMSMGWIILQIGFYSMGLIYLRKPDVRAAFGP